MNKTWKNVSGYAYVTVDWKELEDEFKLLLIDAVCEAGHIELDPKKELNDAELGLYFTSSGYYDPGKYNGLPENCYPACSEDERSMTKVVLYSRNHHIDLQEDVAEKLFEKFHKQVEEAELEEMA